MRRQHNRETRPATHVGPDHAAAVIARATVWRALDALTPHRRAVVVLHEREGLGSSAIASLLGVSAITVRWHLSMGRRDRPGPHSSDGRREMKTITDMLREANPLHDDMRRLEEERERLRRAVVGAASSISTPPSRLFPSRRAAMVVVTASVVAFAALGSAPLVGRRGDRPGGRSIRNTAGPGTVRKWSDLYANRRHRPGHLPPFRHRRHQWRYLAQSSRSRRQAYAILGRGRVFCRGSSKDASSDGKSRWTAACDSDPTETLSSRQCFGRRSATRPSSVATTREKKRNGSPTGSAPVRVYSAAGGVGCAPAAGGLPQECTDESPETHDYCLLGPGRRPRFPDLSDQPRKNG